MLVYTRLYIKAGVSEDNYKIRKYVIRPKAGKVHVGRSGGDRNDMKAVMFGNSLHVLHFQLAEQIDKELESASTRSLTNLSQWVSARVRRFGGLRGC